MIVKIPLVLALCVCIQGVTSASFSKVFVQNVPEHSVEYVQYSAPSVSYSPQIAQLTAAPVGSVVPYSSNYVPCGAPCVYPGQVPSIAPSGNIVQYQTPSLPVVVAPARSEPSGYEYSYVVYDEQTGDHKAQRESSDGSVVRGGYTFLQPDGLVREVVYVADDLQGFNAVVKNYVPATTVEIKNDHAAKEPGSSYAHLSHDHHGKPAESEETHVEHGHGSHHDEPSHENLKAHGNAETAHEGTHNEEHHETHTEPHETHDDPSESHKEHHESQEEHHDSHSGHAETLEPEGHEEHHEEHHDSHTGHAEPHEPEGHEEHHDSHAEHAEPHEPEGHEEHHDSHTGHAEPHEPEGHEEHHEEHHGSHTEHAEPHEPKGHEEHHDSHAEHAELHTPEGHEEHHEEHHEVHAETIHEHPAKSKESHESANHEQHISVVEHGTEKSEVLVSYNDIIKCVQAAIHGANEANVAPAHKPESPLTYIILNKPC